MLTVFPEFYEEDPDPEISRIVGKGIEVIFVKAYHVPRPRLIGDIGLRAFPFLYKAALQLIRSRKIDFIWIPVPSFYTSLLGRIINKQTSVPYGIDYIDPWVRDIHNRRDWRSKLSLQVAKLLEPIAVKRARLVSGVSEAYYRPVIERNFKGKEIAHVGMPYGYDPRDYEVVLENLVLPWADIKGCQPLVYAGAFLPNAHLFIKTLFKVISQKVNQQQWDESKHLYFLGTGPYAGISIQDYAKQFGIENIVHEHRERYPYLHVINFLSSAYAVMAIGSTEPHYTASKIFQALLSKRPVLAMFHHESSAVTVLEECKANTFTVEYVPSVKNLSLEKNLSAKLDLLFTGDAEWKPDFRNLLKYSARASAHALVQKLNELV